MMGAILSGSRKFDLGRIDVKLEGKLLELPYKHRHLYSLNGTYVLKKAQEAASDYHPYIVLYTRKKWIEEVLLQEQKGMDLVGFLNSGIELVARVDNGVHKIELPEDCLQHLRLKGSVMTVLRSVWPGIELWKPEEFDEYKRIESYALGLDKVLQER